MTHAIYSRDTLIVWDALCIVRYRGYRTICGVLSVNTAAPVEFVTTNDIKERPENVKFQTYKEDT